MTDDITDLSLREQAINQSTRLDTGWARLPLDVSPSLSDDFSESDLPYKVDVVDLTPTSASFRTIIARNKVEVSIILN